MGKGLKRDARLQAPVGRNKLGKGRVRERWGAASPRVETAAGPGIFQNWTQAGKWARNPVPGPGAGSERWEKPERYPGGPGSPRVT